MAQFQILSPRHRRSCYQVFSGTDATRNSSRPVASFRILLGEADRGAVRELHLAFTQTKRKTRPLFPPAHSSLFRSLQTVAAW